MADKRIKDLATTITAFRTGDVIPVDGQSGTAKMSKDDLLRVTAENALVGNVAPAFSEAATYSAGDTVVYNGRVYRLIANKASGAWDAGIADPVDAMPRMVAQKAFDKNIFPAFSTSDNYKAGEFVVRNGRIYQFKVAHSAGQWDGSEVTWQSVNPVSSIRTIVDTSRFSSFDDFPVNSIAYISVDLLNNPDQSYKPFGVCFTLGSYGSAYKSQIYFTIAGNSQKNNLLYHRACRNGTWSAWAKTANDSSVLHLYNYIDNSSPYTSFNDLPIGCCAIYKDLNDSPNDSIHPWGTAITIGSDNFTLRTQIFITRSTNATRDNIMYWRTEKSGGTWSAWKTNENCNQWNRKNIVWFGTSIPAGGDYDIDNVHSYPIMVGGLLGANVVYNEAVGSSCARVTNDTYYPNRVKCMGQTIQEVLAIVNDCWTIDDTNQSVSNGPRTLGFTDIPSISTYSAAVKERSRVLAMSFEIKLVARYLISDSTERENYLKARLGNDLYTILSSEGDAFLDMTYKDIDLFVFDHGHNDSISTSNPDYREIADDSSSMTNFIGAMNKFISLVYQYQPKKRIVIVSDYDDFQYKNFDSYQIITIEVQKRVADRWHLPFVDIRKLLPYNNNVKVLTCGYWDKITSVWHNDGFTWSDESGTNAYLNSYVMYGHASTIEGQKEAINPVQDDNGKWWYELTPRDIALKDGLHPHSGKDYVALEQYAGNLFCELCKINK